MMLLDARVVASDRFFRGVLRAGAASNYSHAQLLNPAASGVLVLLGAVKGSQTAATLLRFKRHDTALTTLDGVGFNKNLGAVAAKAELRQQNNGTQLGSVLGDLYLLGNTAEPLLFDGYPLILGAGEGVLVVPDSVNVGVSVFFEWREVAG